MKGGGVSIARPRSAKCASEDVHDKAECATCVVEMARYSAIAPGTEEEGRVVSMLTGFRDGLRTAM